MNGLDPATTDLVLRRAVELSTVEPGSGEIELSPAAVAGIAAEVGVAPTTVAIAIVEHRAGADVDPSFVDRLVGPRVVWARRVSAASEDDTRRRAQRWLSSGLGLKPRVRPDGVVVATKRRGVVGLAASGARRAAGIGGLGRVRQIQVAAVDVDETPGAVCLVADVRNKRSEAIAGGAVLTTGGAAAVGLVAIFAGPVTFVALPVVVGVGTFASRVIHQSTIRRVTDDVEATIDAIASGGEPRSALRWQKKS